ncbi:hypothetical protein [Oceanisphaera ostreae]|uniref:Uncharacterized protein n=1 Tax=Oceanisphaera ostreae TaxID=914151 RepID=A0ABW3KD29_9GAMM
MITALLLSVTILQASVPFMVELPRGEVRPLYLTKDSPLTQGRLQFQQVGLPGGPEALINKLWL